MSKINHSRPYLVYQDNLKRVRANIPYYLDMPTQTNADRTPTQTETLLGHMLVATDAYYEAYGARIDRIANGGKKKQHQATQEAYDTAYEAMRVSMRSFIAHIVLEGLNNNMQVRKSDTSILNRLSKDLGGLPEFTEAFTLEMQHVEDVLLGNLDANAKPAPAL